METEELETLEEAGYEELAGMLCGYGVSDTDERAITEELAEVSDADAEAETVEEAPCTVLLETS